MTNQTNNSISKNYDASDMHDVASLAALDMDWMSTALNLIRKEVARLNKESEKGKLSQHHLTELRTQIDMYSFLAESRHEYHANEADKFEAEWEASKQKVSA